MLISDNFNIPVSFKVGFFILEDLFSIIQGQIETCKLRNFRRKQQTLRQVFFSFPLFEGGQFRESIYANEVDRLTGAHSNDTLWTSILTKRSSPICAYHTSHNSQRVTLSKVSQGVSGVYNVGTKDEARGI